MFTLDRFLEITNNAPAESSKFGWDCYGQNAYILEYWNGCYGADAISIEIVYNIQTLQVFEVQAWDGKTQTEYRFWTTPEYKQLHIDYATKRGVDYTLSINGRYFIDLDVEDDMVDKAIAIFSGRDYDKRISIVINLTDEEELALMRMAHEQDKTLNQLVSEITEAHISKLKEQK